MNKSFESRLDASVLLVHIEQESTASGFSFDGANFANIYENAL